VQPTLTEEIRVAHEIDPQLMKIKIEVLDRKAPGLVIHDDGTSRFHNLVCVPLVDEFKRKSWMRVTTLPNQCILDARNDTRTSNKHFVSNIK